MAQIMFWFSIGVIALVYFGYPLMLSLVAYFNKKPHNKNRIEPYVTLLIPAYNEENVIREKLNNSLSLDYPKEKIEILLILDECTDKTKDIAEQYIDKGIKIIEQKPRRGKMAALNMAVSQARGEILLFTDADVLLDAKSVMNLVENFSDNNIGCVGGELHYESDRNSLVEAGEGLYFSYDKFLRSKESDMQTLFVVSGSIYAMRKSLFTTIREDLADDFINPISVASKGVGVVYDQTAKAFGKIAKTTKDEFGQKVRMITQGFHGSTQIFKFINSKNFIYLFEFIFHKFLRWMVPLFLISIFVSNLFLLNLRFYQVIFYAQILFYLLALAGFFLQERRINIKLFYIPFYFVLINTASLVGFLKFLTGGTRGTWEKAETTRG